MAALANPLLTAREEVELARKIKQRDASARDTLVMSNRRLVWAIAADHIRSPHYRDVIQEGMLALQRAAQRYPEARKETRFARFAAPIIRRQINRYLRRQMVSFTSPSAPDDDGFCDPRPGPRVVAERADTYRAVVRALTQLSPLHVEILSRRFGLAQYEPHTIAGMVQVLGLSSWEIRTLEREALDVLRAHIDANSDVANI